MPIFSANTALDRKSPESLHTQLRNIIISKIAGGEWQPKMMIPSENELSAMYGISRMTARGVVKQLVAEGLVYRIHGRGSFVSSKKIEMAAPAYGGIRSQLEEKGYEVETRLLGVDRVSCNEVGSEKLDIAVGTEMYEIRRIRSIEGRPISYHRSYIPSYLCDGIEKFDLEREQVNEILYRHYGFVRARVVETLDSYVADDEKAQLLAVKKGFPLLLLQDVIANADGVRFEYSRVYFRGDMVTVKLEFDY